MTRKKIRATKLSVGLPFNLGHLEFEPDEIQQKAAWELYVELATRIAVQPLGPDEGIIREALTSLYNLFGVTREILRKSGPAVAQGENSFGAIAIDVLNKGLRPFLVKWHPLLLSHEQKRSANVSSKEHEFSWEHSNKCREELELVRQQLVIYSSVLASIAGIDKSSSNLEG